MAGGDADQRVKPLRLCGMRDSDKQISEALMMYSAMCCRASSPLGFSLGVVVIPPLLHYFILNFLSDGPSGDGQLWIRGFGPFGCRWSPLIGCR
jgi:hypothetical protein